MKSFFWDRLIIAPKNSRPNQATVIWDFIQEPSLDISEFEKHFAAIQKKEKDKPGELSPQKKTITVGDGKKSNAIAIMMSKLPDPSVVLSAIIALDDDKLSLENIEALLDNMPTVEETKALQAAKNPAIPFDKPDHFACQLTTIPFVAERLKCWNFMKNFEEKQKDLFIPLCRIKSACYQLKAYEPMKIILGMILACGNYLNGGTSRGQADGFLLKNLVKVADTKSQFDKNINLLIFIAKQLYAQNSKMMNYGTVPDLREAARVPMLDINYGIQSLSSEVKAMKATANIMADSLKRQDEEISIKNKVLIFMDEAEKTVKHLSVLFKETTALFLDALMWYGWPESLAQTVTNDQFFGDLHCFMESFLHLWRSEESSEERRNFEKMLEKKIRLEASLRKEHTTKELNNNGESRKEAVGPRATLKKKFGKFHMTSTSTL
eukprot:TRINITY_DN9804_c0_g1_i1.p1 TRINITY_DN9804_c0_g1~~TRINITY_DN9804_c0_g1_i1.p1  ORF type:complete len:436 (+),score=123.36 TRINITY_DN9804_c0_g1_i1:768-2075(+)